MLSSGEVVAFGQRFAIARRPHRPTRAELAAAGRLEELDAAVLASLDAILTRERRCYVTAGELQAATGLSRYHLRRCPLPLTQRADPDRC